MATIAGKKLTDYPEATNSTDDDYSEIVQGGLNKKIKKSLIQGSLSTALSTTNSNLASLSTSVTTGASGIASLSTSTSTGLSTVSSNIASLSTSTSSGLSTATSRINSLSTSLSTTDSGLTSLSTSVSTLDSGNVKLAGSQTITGTKSFAATSEYNVTANGIHFYNTADKTTNFESCRIRWNANIFTIDTQQGGTGVRRGLHLDASLITIAAATGSFAAEFRAASAPFVQLGFNNPLVVAGAVTRARANFTGTNAIQTCFEIQPTLAQTGTAGFTALNINPLLTTVGSGNLLLQAWQYNNIVFGSFRSNGNFNVRGTSTFGSADGLTGGSSYVNVLGSFSLAPTAIVNTNVTLGITHGMIIVNAGTSNCVITLPAASTCPGRIYPLKRIDGNLITLVTILPNGAETIDGRSSYSLENQNSGVTLKSDGTRWLVESAVEPIFVQQGFPFINVMSDSGKVTAKSNPLDRVAGAFNNAKMELFFNPYNGSSAWAQVGKFIYDNTTYGGSAGALTQPVIDLLTAQGRVASGTARYGVEYYVVEKTAGTLTTAPHPSYPNNYLATIMATSVGAVFGSGNKATFAGWIRAIDGTQLVIGYGVRTYINGNLIAGGAGFALTPAMGWVHFRCVHTVVQGYDTAFPRIYAEVSQKFQMALPAFFTGQVDCGIHVVPIQNINELIP